MIELTRPSAPAPASRQGALFTSADLTGILTREGVAISMDGKGRATDNMFAERLWRSLKAPSLSHRAVVKGQWYDPAEGGT